MENNAKKNISSFLKPLHIITISHIGKGSKCLQYNFLYFPIFRSTADGNCLFNSCSIVLSGGSEELNNILRSAVSLELAINEDFYTNHPYLVEKYDENSDKSREFIFGITITHESANSKHPIKAEADYIAKNRKWGSLISMLGLSSVVNRKIISVYPETSDIYSRVLNGTILPRIGSPTLETEDDIFIFWSRTSNNVSLEEGKYKANHFVPLIKKDRLDLSSDQNNGTKKKSKSTKKPVKRKPIESIVINDETPAPKSMKLNLKQNTRKLE